MRSASIGSTRPARCAGINPAAADITQNSMARSSSEVVWVATYRRVGNQLADANTPRCTPPVRSAIPARFAGTTDDAVCKTGPAVALAVQSPRVD